MMEQVFEQQKDESWTAQYNAIVAAAAEMNLSLLYGRKVRRQYRFRLKVIWRNVLSTRRARK